MKKKILSFVLAAFFVIPCVFLLSACGHEHEYEENVWINTDPISHWHVCSDCGKKINNTVEQHSYSDDCDTTCDVCGYVREVTHAYANWSGNENGHQGSCTKCGDEGTFEHTIVDGKCSVCDYIQTTTAFSFTYNDFKNGYYVNRLGNTTAKYIRIPSTYNDGTHGEHDVYRINSDAFHGKTQLIEVIIPDTVKFIGDEAFAGCTNLTKINIPNLSSIGDGIFYGCTSLTDVTITSGVSEISEEMFLGCTSLTTITLPDTIKAIRDSAFAECTSLTTIILPNSITTIGGATFYDSGLTKIYYAGTSEEWSNITIDSYNQLNGATKYYFSETQPADTEGHYWHYAQDGKTVVEW